MDDPRSEVELPQAADDTAEPITSPQDAPEWLMAFEDEDSGFVRAYN